jgi:hypothetical protein
MVAVTVPRSHYFSRTGLRTHCTFPLCGEFVEPTAAFGTNNS